MSVAGAEPTPGLQRGPADGHYTLQGALTLATVAGLREQGRAAFGKASGAIVVEMSKVERADSGGLALLVDWLAWAKGAHREMKFTALPAALLALARVSDVEDLLAGR
ncbi:MAG: STAS domain-containing protein [Proteobacteria bacterium]|nr:STAS domain-containing protein [Pseudomonadota bacterium]